MRLSLCLCLLISFWAALYLPTLGTRELQGEEPRRTMPGRTMMQNGDWIVPRSGGEVYNRKPPLVNWLSAGAIKLTGRMDEWTVRMPSVLLMLALGLAALLSLRGWLGNEQALLAALIMLTSIGFIEKGRLAEIEASYMSLFGIALVLWLGLRWQGRDLAAWLASGLVLGIGFLAKGPPHVWYFYALIIGVLLAEKRGRDLLSWKHLAGLAMFFAVWTPWAVMNSAHNPLKDSTAVWQDQITHRLGFAEFDLKNYLLQIPQSLGNFLPWALLLPLCWSAGVTATWQKAGRHGQWMLGLRRALPWAFLVIALLPSSRPRFMLPLNAGAALLVTQALAALHADKLERWSRWWRLGMVFVTIIGIGGLAYGALPIMGHPGEHEFEATGWVLWMLAAWMILTWLWRGSVRTSIVHFGLSTALAFSILGGAFAFSIVPRRLAHEKLRPFVASIVEKTGPTDPVMLYKVAERQWPFYLGMRCYEVADLKDQPRDIAFHWVIVPKNLWTAGPDHDLLTGRLGKVTTETPLSEPLDHSDLVLVRFAGG